VIKILSAAQQEASAELENKNETKWSERTTGDHQQDLGKEKRQVIS
jgi:hypothetical protein